MGVIEDKDPESPLHHGMDYFPAPANLKRTIHSELLREQARMTGQERARDWRSVFSLGGAFASGVATAAAAVALYFSLGQISSLDDDVVAGHIRSLQVAHLSDVTSTDQHTVKPWFTGKLDYSPPVADFSKEGFTLVGGRLDYVGRKSVAALVYAHQQHVINVYLWPVANPKASVSRRESQLHGFNLLAWQHVGMEYWIVSDLRVEELRKFSNLLENSNSTSSKK